MKKIVKLTALLFVVVLVASSLAFSAEAAVADYTRPGATVSSKLTAADILELAMGIELGEAEREYLSLNGEYEILYASHIPTSYVTVGYSGDTKLLVVEAEKYSHTSKSGEVTWTPESVTVGGVEKPFNEDGGKYKAVFESVEEEDDAAARVKYSTQFKVTKAAINMIINQAYDDAEKEKNTIAQKAKEYERLCREFEKNSEDYQKYLAELEDYRAELALYEAYLLAKRKYDDELSEYLEYLDKLEEYERLSGLYDEYEKKLAEYADAYALYEKYLKDKEEYPAKLAAYNSYVEKCKKVEQQLAIIDGTKRFVTSYRRSLYLAICGDTVTTVLKNSDTLTSAAVGIDPAVIEKAENSTLNIREIYDAYFSLTEQKDKYAYYCANYESIRDNFIALFQALDKMYQNPKVRTAINNYGPDMQPKFEILLAQLYYAVNALSDFTVPKHDANQSFTSSYVVNPLTEKKPITILGGEPYLNDTNSAAPLSEGYPSTVKEPVPVEEVEEPEPVEYMAEPTPPDAVSDPGDAPAEIEEPKEPQKVSDPGDAPEPYSPSEAKLRLVSAYERGELVYREKYTGASKKLTASIYVEKSLFNQETCTVEFRDTDGTLLEVVVIDKGSFAEYTGEIPERAEDAAASYTFAGWADNNGVPVDLTSVNDSTELYPYFIPTYKNYTVSWIVDGNISSETLTYGTVPKYDGIPTRPGTNKLEYEFSGWDKPVGPLVEDTVYTAVFTPRYYALLPDGSGADITRNEKGDFTVELGSHSSGDVSLSLLIERAASKGALTVNSKNFSASFAFSEVIAMQKAGVDRISLDLKTEEDSYTIKLNLLNADMQNVSGIRASVSVAASFTDLSKVKVYSLDSEGGRVNANYTLSEEKITVMQTCGTEYYAVAEYKYAIVLVPNSTVTVNIDVNEALVGEWVAVSTEVPDGITLDGIYYTVGTGEEKIRITDDGFRMPRGNVRISVEFHENVYVVQFLSDGKVISSEEYLYGEIPTPPASPKKASDGEYNYTFSGWSAEVCAVTEDAVYEAVYIKEPVPEKEKHDGFYATPGVWKIIIALGVAAVYVLLVFLPCTVILVVRLVLLKRRRLNRNKR